MYSKPTHNMKALSQLIWEMLTKKKTESRFILKKAVINKKNKHKTFPRKCTLNLHRYTYVVKHTQICLDGDFILNFSTQPFFLPTKPTNIFTLGLF